MFKRHRQQTLLSSPPFKRFIPQEVMRLSYGGHSAHVPCCRVEGPLVPGPCVLGGVLTSQRLLPGSQGPSHSGPAQGPGLWAAPGQSPWPLAVTRERGTSLGSGSQRTRLGKREEAGLAPWPLGALPLPGSWQILNPILPRADAPGLA